MHCLFVCFHFWGVQISSISPASPLFFPWVSSASTVEASSVFHLQSSRFTQPWAVPLTTAKLFPDSPRYNFLPWHLIYIWSIITAWGAGRVLLASNKWKPRMPPSILQCIRQLPLQRIICPNVNSAGLEKPALGEWIKPMIETKSARELRQTFKNVSGSTFPYFIFS